jgi:ABC-type phosphate transport system substrate-binding protein
MKMRYLLIAAVAILVLAACSSEPEATPTPRTVAVPSDSEEAESTTEEGEASESEVAPAEEEMVEEKTDLGLPAVDPLSVSGDIVTAGSSTVFPLSERMAERFLDEGYDGNITIDSIGSGAGFERFCVAGETDISNASRSCATSRAPTAVPSTTSWKKYSTRTECPSLAHQTWN